MFFFFKQKTAYEMRISDWSSDVCSSDLAEAVHPYGIGKHRHMPEIEQEITRYAGHPVRVGFTPHLVPMNRGELVTATVDLAEGASVATLRELLAQRYDEEPFVHLLPEGVAPATRMVRGSNHARSEEHTSELQSLMRTS